MALRITPHVVYHADWGCKDAKRWCAKAVVASGTDGHYAAFAPKLVGNLGSLIGRLRTEAGETGSGFAGFDFPIWPTAVRESPAVSGALNLPTLSELL